VGAACPDAFDCSGLAVYAYKAIGITPPNLAFDQVTMGVEVSPDSIHPGDAVLGRAATLEDYGHEAIAIGEMIEAPHTGADVDVDVINQAVQAVRRIITPSTTETAPA